MEGRYTIILLLDENFGKTISKIRADLSNVTKIPSIPPHITLREDFFSKDILGFIKEFKKKISYFKTLNFKILDINVFQRGHVVFIVKNNNNLQKLHEKAVEISQKYVSTPRIIQFECKLNDEQKEMIKKYQLPFYFKYYNPHITIVRLNDFKDKESVLQNIKKYNILNEFKVSNVCIYDKLNNKIYKLIKL